MAVEPVEVQAVEVEPVEVPTDVEAAMLRLANLMAAFGHPHRMRILVLLHFDDKPRSPVDLAEELNAKLGTIAYHVRVLVNRGLIEKVKEQRRRGAIQHFYALTNKGRAVVKWAVELG